MMRAISRRNVSSLLMLDELVEHRIDIVLRAFEVSAKAEFPKQRLVVRGKTRSR